LLGKSKSKKSSKAGVLQFESLDSEELFELFNGMESSNIQGGSEFILLSCHEKKKTGFKISQ
jgi:hypothetical protein